MLATYPPRRCGIATFTSDLRSALADSSGPPLELPVMAVDKAQDNPTDYPAEVIRRFDGTDPDAYRELARADVLDGKCWSSPAYSDASLFVRSTREGVRLDLSGKAGQ
jgi:hypothetical protein